MSTTRNIFITALGIGVILATQAFAQSSGLSSSATTNGISTSSIAPKSGGGIDSATADQFASLLASINSINIDTSIFTNDAYKALRDYPIVLGNDIVGRNDPFAPIGSDDGSVQSDASGGSADGSGGSDGSGDVSATTTPALPLFAIKTNPTTKITATTAQFGASVTMPVPTSVAVVFQYGTTDALGSVTPPMKIQGISNPYGIIRGLLPGTTYYVKAVGMHDNDDPISGNTVSFTTMNQASTGKKAAGSMVGTAKKTKAKSKKSKA